MLRSHYARRNLVGYLMVAPAAATIFLFVFVPFALAFISSLYRGSLVNLEFVGLSNYGDILTSGRFWRSLWVTSLFTLSYTLFSTAIGFVAAVWFNRQGLRFKPLFSSLIVLPFIVTPAVATLVWQYMFDYRFGVLNYALSSLGLSPVPWLREPGSALLALILVQIWFTAGYNMILLASGIQAIPRNYYEAADIDGASEAQKALRITLPLVIPTLVFVLVISLLGGFVNSFVLAQIITGGGPFRGTEVLMLYIYRTAFENFNFPYANALTIVMFALLFTLSLLLNRWQNRVYKGLY